MVPQDFLKMIEIPPLSDPDNQIDCNATQATLPWKVYGKYAACHNLAFEPAEHGQRRGHDGHK